MTATVTPLENLEFDRILNRVNLARILRPAAAMRTSTKRRTKTITAVITLTQAQHDKLIDMQHTLMAHAFRTEAVIDRLTRSTRKNRHELIAEAGRRQASHTIAYADGIGSLLTSAEEDTAAPVRGTATAPDSTRAH